MSTAEKRTAEQSASKDPDAPPTKKQRLNSNMSANSKATGSAAAEPAATESKTPEKPSPSNKNDDIKMESNNNNNNNNNSNSNSNTNTNNNNDTEEQDVDVQINENGIIFLTGNLGKLKEVQSFFDDKIGSLISNIKLDIEETQGTPKEIITKKLFEARKKLNKKASILVEDTSLMLNAYSKNNDSNKDRKNSSADMSDSDMLGFPGPFIKWLLKWDKDGNEGLCKMVRGLNDKTGFALCIFGFLPFNSDIPLFFAGICNGMICDKPKGKDGFGWDPVFVPISNSTNDNDNINKDNLTFAEMTIEMKNQISHRGKALIKLKEYLEKNVSDVINGSNNSQTTDATKTAPVNASGNAADSTKTKATEKEESDSKTKTKE